MKKNIVIECAGAGAASGAALSGQRVLLEFDTHRNTLRVKRDACEFDKGLHSAMVLASVALLVFFIAMTLVERAAGAGSGPSGAHSAGVGPSVVPAGAAVMVVPAGTAAAEGSVVVQPAKVAQAAFFGPIPQSTRVAARLPWSTDAHL
jgi:hypothetical protein